MDELYTSIDQKHGNHGRNDIMNTHHFLVVANTTVYPEEGDAEICKEKGASEGE